MPGAGEATIAARSGGAAPPIRRWPVGSRFPGGWLKSAPDIGTPAPVRPTLESSAGVTIGSVSSAPWSPRMPDRMAARRITGPEDNTRPLEARQIPVSWGVAVPPRRSKSLPCAAGRHSLSAPITPARSMQRTGGCTAGVEPMPACSAAARPWCPVRTKAPIGKTSPARPCRSGCLDCRTWLHAPGALSPAGHECFHGLS